MATAPKASKVKVAFIKDTRYIDMTDSVRAGFETAIDDKVVIHDFVVPSPFEMPLKAQQLARSGDFVAIICCAFIADDGIYRQSFTAQAVLDGIMRVNLDEGVPVVSAVLAPHNYHEHKSHRQLFRKNTAEKGEEVAETTKMLLEIE